MVTKYHICLNTTNSLYVPLGYENEAFEDVMNCMIEGSCISNYPKDGYCVADNEDGDKSLTDLKQLEGDWWVIRGKN